MTYMVDPYLFGGVTELERNASWYQRTSSNVAVTSDARPIGAASATRKVYALISASLGIVSPGPATLNSATIAGISAAIEVVLNSDDDIILAIVSATVPTGSTAVVVATYSHAVRDVMVGCIALDKLQGGGTMHDTVTSQGVEPLSGSIDFPPNGYGIFLARRGSTINALPECVWNGATEFFQELFESEDDGDIFRDPTSAATVLRQSGNGISIQASWGEQDINTMIGLTVG